VYHVTSIVQRLPFGHSGRLQSGQIGKISEIRTDKLAVPQLASDDEKRSFPLAVSTFPFLLFAEIRVIHALSAVDARPLDWAPSHAGFVALRLRSSLLEGTTHLTEETVIRSTVARRVEIWLN
jgi:hypothetical protein